MSEDNDRQLSETLEQHRTFIHARQVATDKLHVEDEQFMREYIAHRNTVIAPTLQKLKKLVARYGHELLIEDEDDDGNSELGGRHAIRATLLLEGFDHTYKTSCPQLGFSANRTARNIAVYASDRVPHEDGVSGQQLPQTIDELTAEKIEQIFREIVHRALSH